MRIGCSTITFPSLPGEDALRLIADLGFQVVDVAAVPTAFDHIQAVDPPHDQAERFAQLVEDLGLEVNGVPTIAWLPDRLNDLEEIRRRSRHVAEVASAVSARSWIVDVVRPSDMGKVHAFERFQRTITIQHDIATEFGLRLAIEAPHYRTLAECSDSVGEVLAAADEAAGVKVGLDFDTSHVHNSGVSLSEMFVNHVDRIVHIAIRDSTGPGQWDIDLGDGDVDFPTFVKTLVINKYQGDLMLELEPTALSVEQRMGLVCRARDHLEQIVGQAVRAYSGASRQSYVSESLVRPSTKEQGT